MIKLAKRILLAVMVVAILATSLIIPGFVVSAAVTSPVTELTTPGDGLNGQSVKQKYSINEGWMFTETKRNEVADSSGNYPSENEYTWVEVDAPHTWWPTDTENSENAKQHEQHDGWYRKTISIPASMKDGRVWIEFEAAGPGLRMHVDNYWVGEHYGGYTNFKFDITDIINNRNAWGGQVTISLKITDSTSYTPPVSGGFTKFPGLTGNVNVIYTDDVSVALVDEENVATSGIYVTPERADSDDVWGTEDDWTVKVESKLSNKGDSKTVKVKTTLRAMNGFENVIDAEFLSFDPATMSEDFTVTKEQTITLSESLTDYDEVFEVKDPRLWNGRTDPFLYYADVEVYSEDGTVLLDKYTESFGFRYYEITKDGFFLNGKSYPLRGGAYHEDFEGVGSGLSRENWEETVKLVYEMGNNFARLSHYPHDSYSYELCDRYGIVVWAEIGLISNATPNYGVDTTEIMPAFVTRAKNHLKELIRQNKNHASIVVWGLENELDLAGISSENMAEFVNELHTIAKAEDPTRLTTQTSGINQQWYNWLTDVNAYNVYPMWYAAKENFEDNIAQHRTGKTSASGAFFGGLDNAPKNAEHWKDKPLGFAEYGAGGSVNHHTEYPEVPENTVSRFHAEEVQSMIHEEAIKAINNHPELWVTSVWNMFDFAEYTRVEGENEGINDKGLVTRDRKTKKDAYYLYQANWVDADLYPVIHITSSRMENREVPENTVTVYSNLDKIELFKGDESLGVQENDGNGIFKWTVSFGNDGETYTYTAKSVGEEVTAKSGVTSVNWTRVNSGQFEIAVNQDKIYLNETSGTITYAGTINASKIGEIFTSRYNATIELVTADGTPVTSGIVEGGMKLRITAENGDVKEYVMYASSIAIGKEVTVSTGTRGETTVDGVIPEDLKTITTALQKQMWNPVTDKGTITVDLGKVYTLNNATLYMFMSGNSRKYYYNIYVATAKDENGELINPEKVVDRTNNTVSGAVSDTLNGVQGRYVQVEFTGNNGGGQIALFEIEISGYIVSGTEVEFDHENKTVTIPYGWTNENNMANLMNDVKIEGNAYFTVEADKYYLEEGSKLVVHDITGGRTEYSVVMGTEPPYSGDTYSWVTWLVIMLASVSLFAVAVFLGKKKAGR